MTTQNILLQVDNDLNFLCHSNTKGSYWYQHDLNKRWQRQAAYAKGQPNPDAKTASSGSGEKKGNVLTRAGSAIKTAAGNAYTKHVAKNDAAWDSMLNSDKVTKGHARIGGTAIGIGTGATALGAAIGSKVAGNAANKKFDKRAVEEINGIVRQHRAGGGLVGTLVGGTLGGAAAMSYLDATYNGYAKRSGGGLKNTRMTPAQRQLYKDTFNKYKDKYSKPITIAGHTFKA